MWWWGGRVRNWERARAVALGKWLVAMIALLSTAGEQWRTRNAQASRLSARASEPGEGCLAVPEVSVTR